MLSINDLVNIDHIPDESEVSLDLLIDFFENYMCKRIFNFTLSNQETVKLMFKVTDIFHVSGFSHIYKGSPMKASRFIEEAKQKKIDFQSIRNVNPKSYKDYEPRVQSMFCLDTIIKKCEYLLFADSQIPDTEIAVKYLLLKGLDNKNLHLGIDNYREGAPFFTKTLLVTTGNSIDKFKKKAINQFRIDRLEIIDKETDNCLEIIERKKAIEKSLIEINDLMNEWFEHFGNKLICDCIVNVTVDSIRSCANTSKGSAALAIVSYGIKHSASEEDVEKNGLFEGLDIDIQLSDDEIVEQVKGIVNRKEKESIKTKLNSYIDSKKNTLIESIIPLDEYWSKKIVGETIKETKKNVYECINDRITRYIESNMLYISKMVMDALRSKN